MVVFALFTVCESGVAAELPPEENAELVLVK